MRRSYGRSRRTRGRSPGVRVAFVLLFVALVGGIGYLLNQAITTGTLQAAQAEAARPAVSSDAAPKAETRTDPVVEEIKSEAASASRTFGFQTAVMQSDAIVERYQREQAVNFGADKAYATVRGVTSYGGNNYRNSFTYGTQTMAIKRMRRIWAKEVGTLRTESGDEWQGTGWTGMPVIVRWDDGVRPVLGIADAYKAKSDFTEVIYPATDGKIYCFELGTGLPTRDPIEIGAVMKGTATLDPRGYPILYVGQGAEDSVDGRGAWVRAVSLIENKVIWRFGGKDKFAYREYQAYDGSALLDAKTDTLFVPGENGVLYSVKLNTKFDAAQGAVTLDPEPLVKYRYTADGYGTETGARTWGIESSISAYGKYGFVADNGGYLQCIDLNAMMLTYAVDLKEETDATVVIEPEGEGFSLYTATMARQADASGKGLCYQRKLNGSTGEILWEKSLPVYVGDAMTSGSVTTPHAGHGNIAELVIFNCTMVPYGEGEDAGRGGCIIAYNKQTGAEVWRYTQSGGYWSSPVVIYDEKETAYLIQCDRTGIMMLFDAATGEQLFKLDMGSRVESTPAVFEDMLVVGTRGRYGSGETSKIIGVKLG